MRVRRNLSPAFNAATSIIIALVMLSAVQAAQNNDSTKIQIKNFGCVNEKFYRGAQPGKRDYTALAAFGIKTIVDLQRKGEDDEQTLVEAAGMKFYRIEMSDKSRPTPEQTEEFLKIVNDDANQPVFIHCHGGRHRTGAMTAIYRMTHDGWTAERAYREMKQFDFEHGMGHGDLKAYVFDYFANLEQKGAVVNTNK